jgi:hypothetical protein
MTNQKQETADDKPPFFSSWSRMYWLLMGVLGVFVVLFYIFTLHYS